LEQHPDLRLTLVGDGDDRAHLEDLAKPLGGAVHFAGFQSQEGVADALAAADALVLPSFAEGLPVVLMEALAAGKPVVCTQVAGVGELVEDGVSGYLCPASDVDTLADRLGRIASDPNARKAMGQAGREKVRAEFDIRREAARIGSLFAGHLDGPVRPDPYEGSD
jgi:glycosyltransferase involved in cell wall biosynthesis